MSHGHRNSSAPARNKGPSPKLTSTGSHFRFKMRCDRGKEGSESAAAAQFCPGDVLLSPPGACDVSTDLTRQGEYHRRISYQSNLEQMFRKEFTLRYRVTRAKERLNWRRLFSGVSNTEGCWRECCCRCCF